MAVDFLAPGYHQWELIGRVCALHARDVEEGCREWEYPAVGLVGDESVSILECAAREEEGDS